MKPWEEIETERERYCQHQVSSSSRSAGHSSSSFSTRRKQSFLFLFLNGREHCPSSTHTNTWTVRVLVRGSEALTLGGAEVGSLHGVEFVDGIDGWGGEEVARSALRPAPQSLLQPHQAALLAVQAEVALQVDAASAPFRMRRRTVVRTCNEGIKKKRVIISSKKFRLKSLNKQCVEQ